MIKNRTELTLAQEQSERLEAAILEIRTSLAGRPEISNEMASSYESQLRAIRLDIDSFLGVKAPSGADLILRVESPDIGSDGAPTSILVETLETFRKAIAATLVGVRTGRAKTQGRPPAELRVASDPKVLWLAPGSLRIGVDLPSGYHQTSVLAYDETGSMTRAQTPIQQSVALLLKAAEWASSDLPVAELDKEIEKPAVRKAVLEQVRKLSPSPMGRVTALTIEGSPSILRQPIRLTESSRDRAREAAYQGSQTRDFEDTGTLKRVHVDIDTAQHSFDLRERPRGQPDIRGDFPEELRVRIFHAIQNQYRVRVRGILETKPGSPGKQVLHLEDFDREGSE